MKRVVCGVLITMVMAFLTGCEAKPPAKMITAIDQTDFVNMTTGDHLRLELRGGYSLRPPGSQSKVRLGHWELLSSDDQVITLDGQAPIRLAYLPGAKEMYQYKAVALRGYSTLQTNELDNYERLQGQWFAAKAELVAAPGELPLSELLRPQTRGTR